MKRKLIAAAIAGALALGSVVVGAAPANAAGGATVCNHTTSSVQGYYTNGAWMYLGKYSCANGVAKIAPPQGRCYTITGGTGTTVCGRVQLVLVAGRTYYIKSQW